MSHRCHVVLIAPHGGLSRILGEQFGLLDDFVLATVETLDQLQLRAETDHIDLILLHSGDTTLASVAGLRGLGFGQPIIVLGAGETNGASEEMRLPLRMSHLLARMKAHLRHHESGEEAALPIRSFIFRPGARLLIPSEGEPLRLTEKEVAILRYLHRMGERPVSRDVLLAEVWGYNTSVTTHTLETHIYRLRQKLEDDPSNAAILVTDSGGYKLLA
jgi:DNA-binding response OmpR family regulator